MDKERNGAETWHQGATTYSAHCTSFTKEQFGHKENQKETQEAMLPQFYLKEIGEPLRSFQLHLTKTIQEMIWNMG